MQKYEKTADVLILSMFFRQKIIHAQSMKNLFVVRKMRMEKL